MRSNQLWAVHNWMPVPAAMSSMQVALKKNPAKGLLGMEQWVVPTLPFEPTRRLKSFHACKCGSEGLAGKILQVLETVPILHNHHLAPPHPARDL